MSTPTDHPGSGVVITVCPSGPLLVRGPVEIVDADGHPVAQRRSTIALCRCGKSSLAPFCDGTHKLIKRRSADAGQ